ncbi:MAG: S24 family peptidase [Gammaproteobacteria bacterium]
MNDVTHCEASEPFALRVIGNDMLPEFEDGNIVIVDPGGLVKSGCYVVAKAGEDMVLRQLHIDNSSYRLTALQPGTGDILLKNGLKDVVGVISQRAGKRRSQHKRYDL